jgi:hypothetical protein
MGRLAALLLRFWRHECLKVAACCQIDCSAAFDPEEPMAKGGFSAG